jgi:hypothetical protein
MQALFSNSGSGHLATSLFQQLDPKLQTLNWGDLLMRLYRYCYRWILQFLISFFPCVRRMTLYVLGLALWLSLGSPDWQDVAARLYNVTAAYAA